MKTQNLFGMLLLMVIAFSFASCDDENKEVNLSQLKGKWFAKEPVLPDDFTVSYQFNADKTCVIHIGSPLTNSAPINCTYEIDADKHLLTLFDKEKKCTEQYYITKLTSGEMKWKNTLPGDENTDKRLEKYKE